MSLPSVLDVHLVHTAAKVQRPFLILIVYKTFILNHVVIILCTCMFFVVIVFFCFFLCTQGGGLTLLFVCRRQHVRITSITAVYCTKVSVSVI